MGNKDIARLFNLLAGLLELHGENAFKTRTYANAYLALRKWDRPLDQMSPEEIDAIPGIGASVASKIKEYLSTGQIEALEKVRAITPEGIQQLLSIKGLGPKKIRVIWDELKVESPAELLYACNENRLVALSGFGYKTQEDLRQKITYFLDSQHKYLYGNIEADLQALLERIRKALPGYQAVWAGEYATMSPVIHELHVVIAPPVTDQQIMAWPGITISAGHPDGQYDIVYEERIAIKVHSCDKDNLLNEWCQLTLSPDLYERVAAMTEIEQEEEIDAVLKNAGYPGMPAEYLDLPGAEELKPEAWQDLITADDIRGILHNHSTWSDGIHSLEEMAEYVRDRGYAYFAICDHSRSAFYANGLPADRVLEQMEEIDRLNARLAPFRIFKGIESDILGDGSLDYEDDVLRKFDLVVASIHSNLRMDEEKAMSRLIRAIENPYTRILGHPTGRLLLARQGYPVDHRKLIDACAANGVAIELNANPLRLDIDYTWLDYCMQKEVWVSINPDAHSRHQVDYVRYGVNAARKGRLKRTSCLNALSLEEFERWLRMSR